LFACGGSYGSGDTDMQSVFNVSWRRVGGSYGSGDTDMQSVFNVSWRRVGGLRFLKLGRITFMVCLSREYVAFGQLRENVSRTNPPCNHRR